MMPSTDPLVRAIETGTLRSLSGVQALVYSVFLALIPLGQVRVFSLDGVAKVAGVSERHARRAIDVLTKRNLIIREPIRHEHRLRFTARYKLPG